MTVAPAAPQPEPERVTELALALADLVPRLPEDERRAISRLLAQSIAVPSRAQRREDLLGLLVEMARGGLWVTTTAYEQERERRAAQGQEWPSHTTLIARFAKGNKKRGDAWRKAVEMAVRLAVHGPPAHVRADNLHRGLSKPYTRDEVTDLIREYYWRHGTWPTQWEFHEWGRARRINEGPSARSPSRQRIRKLFGSWDRAFSMAQSDEAAP